jgi:hypothetical protein
MMALIAESTASALGDSAALGLSIAAASVATVEGRRRLQEWAILGLRRVPRILVFELAETLVLRVWYAAAILENTRAHRMFNWDIVVSVCAGIGLAGYLVIQGLLGIVPAVLTLEVTRLWASLRRAVSLSAGNRWRVAILVLISLALETFVEVAIRTSMSLPAVQSNTAAFVWEGAPLLIAGLFVSLNGILLAIAYRWLCTAHEGVLPNEAAAAFD